ncbi:glycine cleavage system protein GcvH [Teredinibacter turnerae]|uniref:Glycine cleavage system H protein n=1 Tax=Teredinibacter turnerae (strain ATCC 39867 / T7901) TaxID=377629 RepID=GCSH_TERTT|nr:glycine cleavage system protein GcvH [Teredinibacter turnerae]C5BM96.1 RecName: Full=Glycine cleavage system H protein [Teredinibacter turnerae T7901]ACR11908.1 glycine cleavage system H protein [Teredinibacter turnerae T7901]
MSEIRSELKYLSSHEWARVEEDGTVTIGITDHAQEALGDVVFVETPEVGSQVSAGEEAGVVESVKAASDIYSPVTGEVIAVNELLEEAPETVNESPYDEGWFFKVKPSDVSELDGAMDSEAYVKSVEDDS